MPVRNNLLDYQAGGGLLGVQDKLRGMLNHPLLGPLPGEEYMPDRFNPTMMQGKNLIAEMTPLVGDAKAIEDAQGDIPVWQKVLNYASVAPGIGDLARLGGNAMPLLGAMTAFHGSPHKFDKFDISKIGTGEGAQAYGHGLYFAESPGVAKSYQSGLSNSEILIDGNLYKSDTGGVYRNESGELFKTENESEQAAMQAMLYGATRTKDKALLAEEAESFLQTRQWATPEIIEGAKAFIKSGRVKVKDTGSLYEVDIPDSAIDTMLDWDKPLSEQTDLLKSKADELGYLIEPIDEFADNERIMTGGEFYRSLYKAFSEGDQWAMEWAKTSGYDPYSGDFGSLDAKQLASEYLNSLGIKGIKYLDQASRTAGEGTRNFVVFDDSTVKILNRK